LASSSGEFGSGGGYSSFLVPSSASVASSSPLLLFLGENGVAFSFPYEV